MSRLMIKKISVTIKYRFEIGIMSKTSVTVFEQRPYQGQTYIGWVMKDTHDQILYPEVVAAAREFLSEYIQTSEHDKNKR